MHSTQKTIKNSNWMHSNLQYKLIRGWHCDSAVTVSSISINESTQYTFATLIPQVYATNLVYA